MISDILICMTYKIVKENPVGDRGGRGARLLATVVRRAKKKRKKNLKSQHTCLQAALRAEADDVETGLEPAWRKISQVSFNK